MRRLALALRTFFSVLSTGALSDELAAALGLSAKPPAQAPPAPAPQRTERAADGALQMLAILQQEARLVDFLMEDISAYPDEQVGAAVRSLHQQCRQALERHVRLVPVIDGVEGTYTRVVAAPDPSAVKLVGNVPLKGRPEGGLLRHRGWRALSIELPPPAPDQDPALIAPAEIEI